MTNNTQNDEETIRRELEGEENKDLNEERLVGPSDEDDDDPADTTPAEASEQADEGEEILKRQRESIIKHEEDEMKR